MQVPDQDGVAPDDAPLTNAELVQLRIRVIALENLVIALLAEAPDRQLALARGMATYISPRTGATPHPVTTPSAALMATMHTFHIYRFDRRYCSLACVRCRTDGGFRLAHDQAMSAAFSAFAAFAHCSPQRPVR